jgi:hypothetical protein
VPAVSTCAAAKIQRSKKLIEHVVKNVEEKQSKRVLSEMMSFWD